MKQFKIIFHAIYKWNGCKCDGLLNESEKMKTLNGFCPRNCGVSAKVLSIFMGFGLELNEFFRRNCILIRFCCCCFFFLLGSHQFCVLPVEYRIEKCRLTQLWAHVATNNCMRRAVSELFRCLFLVFFFFWHFICAPFVGPLFGNNFNIHSFNGQMARTCVYRQHRLPFHSEIQKCVVIYLLLFTFFISTKTLLDDSFFTFKWW